MCYLSDNGKNKEYRIILKRKENVMVLYRGSHLVGLPLMLSGLFLEKLNFLSVYCTFVVIQNSITCTAPII
jgi:hypothetical protein